ncbi:MAG: helix-turn-helix domain-containing protein [Microcoleaceae cyanobacterium]
MELKPASNYSYSGHIPIEIDRDGWRSLLTNIEPELQTSQVYSQILTDLKSSLEAASALVAAQIKTLEPDKIKQNLKSLTRTFIPEKTASSTNLNSSETTNTNIDIDEKEKSLPQQQPMAKLIQNNKNQIQKQMITNLTTSIESETTTESIPISINSENIDTNLAEKNQQNLSEELQPQKTRKKRKKKLTKAEQAALITKEKNTYLYQLGQQLQKARQMRCLSLKQIHRQTFVPLHYLEAIEKGHTEELPEDVYLKGFIFRIGNVLGLDGANLAAALPISDPLQGIISSWSPDKKDSGFYLHPVHLYVGYTALMAGALGGLSLMSQQQSPGAHLIPDTSETPDSVARSDRDLETTQTPGLKSTAGNIVVGSDMAPPETMI